MRWQIVAIAVVATTAGCPGFVANEQTPTVSPVAVPSTETRTDVPKQVAPGLGRFGVGNARALATTHEELLHGRSYTLREQIHIEPQGGNSSRARTLRRTVTVENATRYAYFSSRVYRQRNGTMQVFWNYSAYVDGETRYARFERRATGEVAYDIRPADQGGEQLANESNETILRYLSVRRSNVTVADYDGRRYYRVRGTGADPDRLPTLHNYSVTAYVNPSGFVRILTATYYAGGGGGISRYTYQFQYHNIGSTIVSEPSWLPVARNRTADGI